MDLTKTKVLTIHSKEAGLVNNEVVADNCLTIKASNCLKVELGGGEFWKVIHENIDYSIHDSYIYANVFGTPANMEALFDSNSSLALMIYHENSGLYYMFPLYDRKPKAKVSDYVFAQQSAYPLDEFGYYVSENDYVPSYDSDPIEDLSNLDKEEELTLHLCALRHKITLYKNGSQVKIGKYITNSNYLKIFAVDKNENFNCVMNYSVMVNGNNLSIARLMQ